MAGYAETGVYNVNAALSALLQCGCHVFFFLQYILVHPHGTEWCERGQDYLIYSEVPKLLLNIIKHLELSQTKDMPNVHKNGDCRGCLDTWTVLIDCHQESKHEDELWTFAGSTDTVANSQEVPQLSHFRKWGNTISRGRKSSMPPFREISISRNQETLLNQMQKSSFPEVWKPRFLISGNQ